MSDNNSQPAQSNPQIVPITSVGMVTNATIEQTVVDAYCNAPYLTKPEEECGELLIQCKLQRDIENATKPKGEKLKNKERLSPISVAKLLNTHYRIAKIPYYPKEPNPALAVYQDSGEHEGVWKRIIDPVNDDNILRNIIVRYNPDANDKYSRDVFWHLSILVETRSETINENITPFKNGIWYSDRRVLEPFSQHPELTFCSKNMTKLIENAPKVVITNPDGTIWELDSWMQSLTDDPEKVEMLYEVAQAVLRPQVPWNKTVWLKGPKGNGGKSTFLALLRNCVGEEYTDSIALEKFGENFALENLPQKRVILTDESDEGVYIDKIANLRAIITGDTVGMNRKFRTKIDKKWPGMMIFCMNHSLRVKTKSDSFLRRLLIIELTKSFQGVERKYIKQKYLRREDVKEYFVSRVIYGHPTIDTFSDAKCCEDALAEYKEDNDNVVQFLNEHEDMFAWDLVPFTFLYSCYKKWLEKVTCRSGDSTGGVSQRMFIERAKSWAETSDLWYIDYGTSPNNPDKKVVNKTTTGHLMDATEPLIVTYDLQDWRNPDYHGSDIDKICCPRKEGNYRGILRK